VSSRKTRLIAALATAVAAGAAYTPVIHAINFGDFMNPGKWMGGGNDYDDEYYEYGPGPYGPPGPGGPYGPGPYGAGPYGAGPYGAPGYGPYGGGPGFGAPGYYGAPGPRPAPAAPSAPASSSSSSSENVKSAEIEALRKRIEELEAKQQPAYAAPPPADWGTPSGSAPAGGGWGSAPAFRPMDKY
jgi:hypothetical protein